MPEPEWQFGFLRGAWRGVGYVLGFRKLWLYCGSICSPCKLFGAKFCALFGVRSQAGPSRKPVALLKRSATYFPNAQTPKNREPTASLHNERFSNANSTRRVAGRRDLFPSGHPTRAACTLPRTPITVSEAPRQMRAPGWAASGRARCFRYGALKERRFRVNQRVGDCAALWFQSETVRFLEMRFAGVLLHHHLDRDSAHFTKLVNGVNAQRLMPNPVLDGAQQRRSHPVVEERMLLVDIRWASIALHARV
jgi:hypothetical protein